MDWKDEYSVGVSMIDEEHKQLLLLISNLHAAVASAPETAAARCDELIAHALEHFAHEEQHFGLYPRAEPHRRMHQKLKERLTEYRSRLDQVPLPASADLTLFEDFLAHHIAGPDRAYGAWLNAQGIH